MNITPDIRRALAAVAVACGGLLLVAGSGGGGGGGGGEPPVAVAPAITTQPQAQTVSAGANVSFSVVATGTAPLAYQWQRDGTAVAGATAATLAFVASAGDNGASFRVVVSNTAGSATSNAAVLTVGSTGVGTLNGIGVSAGDASVWLPVTATVPGRPAATSTVSQSFNLQSVAASERVILRNAAAGHVDQVKVVAVRAGAVTFVRSTLWPAAAASTLDPAAGGTVGVAGTAGRLVLPAAALRRAADGAAPSGNAAIVATALAGARDPDRLPGDYGVDDGGVIRPFESLGAVALAATDGAGQALQLVAGQAAQLRIPVSSRDTAALPASTPVYRFDEGTARWLAAGTGTLGGSGDARHYEVAIDALGTFSAGRLIDTVRVVGCTQNGSFRTRNRVVRTEGVAATFAGYAFSGADGSFSVAVPRNQAAVLYTFGSVESSLPVVVGPSATDITLAGCQAERGTDTAAPTFVVQPQSQAVAAGNVVRLTAVLDGKLPMGLQWRRNGVPIAGETGNALVFAAGAADDGAAYTLVATNATGTTTSAPAVLTVSGGGTGSGGTASCDFGMPPEGTRFQAGYELLDGGTAYGTSTIDVLMRGTALFEGVSARFSSVATTSSTASGGVASASTAQNDVFANATAPGVVTRYGQTGSYTSATGTARSTGTTKIVYTPASADATGTLAVGGSLAQSSTFVTTGTRDGVVQAPLTTTLAQTTRLDAIENVTVPAGTYLACRYTLTIGATTITQWLLGGNGGLLKSVSGSFEQRATSVVVTAP